jgi:hypothetical protein
VPKLNNAYTTELMETLLDNDEVEVPKNDAYYASQLEVALMEDNEAHEVISKHNHIACLKEWARQYEHARQINWLLPTEDSTTMALREALRNILKGYTF